MRSWTYALVTVVGVTSLGWLPTGPMEDPRMSTNAVRLPTGDVFVAGGKTSKVGMLPYAEKYIAAKGTWTRVATMPDGRMRHAAVLLKDGRVLVSGGFTPFGDAKEAAIYDPVKDTWVAAGTNKGRYDHQLVVLSDGRVLAIGGSGWDPSAVERFDPATLTWTRVAPMSGERVHPSVTKLPDDRVLVAGGVRPGTTLSSVEIYDPKSDTWKLVAPMATARSGHGAALLSTNRIAVFGGSSSGSTSASVELYDWVKDTWTAAAPMLRARRHAATVVLPNGKVLLAGGLGDGPLADTEVFDPATGTFAPAGSMAIARGGPLHALLADGSILIAGGQASTEPGVSATAELFKLIADGAPCAGAGECRSGFCVDGVCCASACTGSCDACDVVGKHGSCTPLSTGPPRPGKSCGGFRYCVAGGCATRCSSDSDCTTRCEPDGTCARPKSNGEPCGANVECASTFCVDGRCCNNRCDAQCDACDVGGRLGVCSAVFGAPHGARPVCAPSVAMCIGSSFHEAPACHGSSECRSLVRDCAPYGCSSLGCASSCSSDADCAAPARCREGVCGFDAPDAGALVDAATPTEVDAGVDASLDAPGDAPGDADAAADGPAEVNVGCCGSRVVNDTAPERAALWVSGLAVLGLRRRVRWRSGPRRSNRRLS